MNAVLLDILMPELFGSSCKSASYSVFFTTILFTTWFCKHDTCNTASPRYATVNLGVFNMALTLSKNVVFILSDWLCDQGQPADIVAAFILLRCDRTQAAINCFPSSLWTISTFLAVLHSMQEMSLTKCPITFVLLIRTLALKDLWGVVKIVR